VTKAWHTLIGLTVWVGAVAVPVIQAQEAPADLARLVETGRFEAAREECLRRLGSDPDAPEALYYMGRLSADGASARRHFERLLEAHPGHALADSARMEMAELTFAGPYGLYRQARGRYLEVLARNPVGPHAALALCRIGQTYLIGGNPDSARTYFTRSLEHDPHSSAGGLARMGLVQADLQAGDSSAAAARMAALGEAGAGAVFGDLARKLAADNAAGERVAATRKPRQAWIQVGAFRVAAYAQRLVTQLASLGIAAEAVAAPGRGLHLVFAGPYPDRASAGRALERIRQETDIRGYIVNRP
jgi:tetratricopeptide (TPR) repeat protein